MKEEIKYVYRKGGSVKVPIQEIEIPDIWHIAERIGDREGEGNMQAVLEVWHIAHDLLRNLNGFYPIEEDDGRVEREEAFFERPQNSRYDPDYDKSEEELKAEIEFEDQYYDGIDYPRRI